MNKNGIYKPLNFKVELDQKSTCIKHTVANFCSYILSGEKKDDEPEKMDTTPVTDEKKGLYHLTGFDMIMWFLDLALPLY